MHNRNYKAILYFIGLVILVTLSIQLYWNYKNFQSGKQQLINEVQTSLDNAIDAYYVDLADRNTVGLTLNDGGDITKSSRLDSLYKFLDKSKTDLISSLDSLDPKKLEGLKIFKSSTFNDTSYPDLKKFTFSSKNKAAQDSLFGSVKKLRFPKDSIFKLASKVIISITTDTLQISDLNNFIDEQLQQKNIETGYGYVFENNSGDVQEHNLQIRDNASLSTTSKSAYLPKKSSFKFYFNPNTGLILKRNMMGLLLSAILMCCVVGCLLFMLKVINRQKQLAEIKNDLIGNITHEFKTPIATIKAALEGITNFNKNNDPVKTRNYLEISNAQLGKLQMMVEKLLETATLDGDQLKLKKEEVSVDVLVKELVMKHQRLASNKNFYLKQNLKKTWILADPFHLENALNNILDNAVKYGGDEINIQLQDFSGNIKITIEDSGKMLTKEQADKVFEKFYRVPHGNMHDIKGFGIGLYYTLKVIEKHHGQIHLEIKPNTKFTIFLPHE
ncbi:HAMP domain-containing sensor histidine kinase [Christiangramia sp.]|uniref:sensor histidine kinase n=1 Tax=Christiangramia sp. TaxID=1931228 RepID=UPI00261CE735|nr:HAMP domain-containing sensor histidine kinase [Christiangramia sp.]